jgi:hypothetical protein
VGDYGKPEYAPSFWLRVLKAIDDELTSPQDMVVIGGAAIGLHYKSPHLTSPPTSTPSLASRTTRNCGQRSSERSSG